MFYRSRSAGLGPIKDVLSIGEAKRMGVMSRDVLLAADGDSGRGGVLRLWAWQPVAWGDWDNGPWDCAGIVMTENRRSIKRWKRRQRTAKRKARGW